jgi:hypothetical protein
LIARDVTGGRFDLVWGARRHVPGNPIVTRPEDLTRRGGKSWVLEPGVLESGREARVQVGLRGHRDRRLGRMLALEVDAHDRTGRGELFDQLPTPAG